MTAAKVVDASAVAALLFAEVEADRVAAALRGNDLLAPSLLEFEVANVCWKKCRRDPDRRLSYIQAFEALARLPIELRAVDQLAVLPLALATGLTPYDASYLWLSQRMSAELVTLDNRLARVAGATLP